MSGNAQKTPIARTLEQFTARKVGGIIELLGKALPASVVSVISSGIVDVKFELTDIPYTLPNINVPIFGPEYVRYPIQPGCKGVVFPADAYLGGVSGLGGGAANLTQRGNLSTLVFFPIGNKGWSPTEDQNSLVLYGPDGVIIRDINKKTTFTLTANGIVIKLQSGDAVEIDGKLIVKGDVLISGNIRSETGGVYAGNIETSGNVIAGEGTGDQVGLQTHTHPAPGGETGAPTAGT